MEYTRQHVMGELSRPTTDSCVRDDPAGSLLKLHVQKGRLSALQITFSLSELYGGRTQLSAGDLLGSRGGQTTVSPSDKKGARKYVCYVRGSSQAGSLRDHYVGIFGPHGFSYCVRGDPCADYIR